MFPLFFALQAIGAVSSAYGAKYAAQGQQFAIKQQAAMDLYGAQSDALAMHGRADLEGLNAQSRYSYALVAAEFTNLDAIHQASQMRAHAAISGARASSSIIGLGVGATIDDNNAALLELQAEGSLRRGEHQEQDARMKFAEAKSKATASMAARGIDLSQGSALAVRAGHDLMSENTAIRIQQEVLLEVTGQRMAAQNQRISAAGKRAQASAIAGAAGMEAAFAESNAQFTEKMAGINLEAAKAMAAAGLINDNAAVQYQHSIADIKLANASVAHMVRVTQANSISPSAAFNSTILGSLPGLANSAYGAYQSFANSGTYAASLRTAASQYGWD